MRNRPRRRGHLFVASLGRAALPHAAATAEEEGLWVAVTRPGLAQALEPLAEKRRRDGFDVVVLTQPVESALQGLASRPDFLLLLGDYEPGKEQEPWYVPPKQLKLYRWRRAQPKEFSSDSAWGDLDGDLVPDTPVGRIPARTREQADMVVAKILAFERRQPTPKDLRLLLWGGVPGYGAVIDSWASSLLVVNVQLNAPPWVAPWIISGDPKSAFCGWPPDQPALFNRELKQGCILAGLMGHASRTRFSSMRFRSGSVTYTARGAQQEFTDGPPAPPVVIFACSAGDFGSASRCLAESLPLSQSGPVAAIGATTESHPLPNYFSGVCLLQALNGTERRIGALWLETQRNAMKARDIAIEYMLRDAEGKLEPEINVDKLRADHILMYALLGDPATRLRLPLPLEATVHRRGAGWQWKAVRPKGATELHVGFRADQAIIPPMTGPLQQADARALIRSTNSAREFKPLPSPRPGEPWEGTVKERGWLRLVATGPAVFHVAVLKLGWPRNPPPAGE